jgi:hypothetical protein
MMMGKLPRAGEPGFPEVGTPEREALTRLVIQRRSAGLTPCCGVVYLGETNRCSSCDGVVARPIQCNALRADEAEARAKRGMAILRALGVKS